MNSTNITTFPMDNNTAKKAEKLSIAQELSAISKACKIACLSNELTIDEAAFAFAGVARISENLTDIIND